MSAESAAEHKHRFLVSMECDETGERIEGYVNAVARTAALTAFLRRSATVVALMQEKSWRFVVVGGDQPEAAHVFDSLSVRMDES